MEFLQGLHDRYTNLCSQILLTEPFPSVQRIFNLVKQEEEQQHINATPRIQIDVATLYVRRSNSDSQRSQNKHPRPFCEHCNKHDHTLESCYQIHGFPSKNSMNNSHNYDNVVANVDVLLQIPQNQQDQDQEMDESVLKSSDPDHRSEDLLKTLRSYSRTISEVEELADDRNNMLVI
ncbi:hypothetical protein OSB04_028036 [Centaurea solstitialis]|uniref:Uncharacterized protein n=1 Tax=Centaurea solstitialis TaxID=347529 RepID=A0AA38SEY3_9ASTR|nr:hypothetical protein OSB04_028036 [Centaurea solstitialis]